MSLRNVSKREYIAREFTPTETEINVGSLQRIADAVERQATAAEKMTQSYDALRNDRDYWKGAAERSRDEASRLRFSIRSLKGVITKLRRSGGHP